MSIFLIYSTWRCSEKITQWHCSFVFNWYELLPKGVIYTRAIAHCPRCQKTITPHYFLTCSHTWRCSENNNSVALLLCVTVINSFLRGVIYTKKIAHSPRCQKQLLYFIFSPAHILEDVRKIITSGIAHLYNWKWLFFSPAHIHLHHL